MKHESKHIQELSISMIDGDTCIKSLLFVSDSLEQLIGQNGAKAVLRSAGQQASSQLIDMLPLTLSEPDAIQRSGLLLAELGFITALYVIAQDTLEIDRNYYMEQLTEMNLSCMASARYYVIGLFEGFFKQLCDSKMKITSVEIIDGHEIWKLG